jgi:malonyl-CoA/methylmalonyl-CoA synthetase
MIATGLNPDEALYFLKKTKAAYILTEKRTLEMATTFTDHARNEGQRVTLITITRADPATATISSSTELEINQELTFPETAACLILFTSGTTGPPKDVVLPRKMFHYEEDITPATLYLASCPPHWIGGTGLIDSVLIGENLHMLKSEAPPARFWEVLREGRATEMAISPTMLRRLMEYYQEHISHLAAEQRNEYIDGAKKLERVIVSGSMLSPSTWRFFADLTGMPIINGYGITEMGGGVIINPPGAVYEQVCAWY